MKLLFLSPRQCWPTHSGAKLREYYFLRELSRQAEVDYVYFADPRSEPLTPAVLPDCRHIVSVPKPDAYTISKKILGLVGKWPLPVRNYTSRLMIDAVRKLRSTNDYDLVHLDSIHLIRYAEGLAAPAVYDWHNIESETILRYSGTVDSLAKSMYARTTAKKMQRLERRILSTEFGHIVCSERERVQLSSSEPGARIAVVENGVDTTFFTARKRSVAGDRKTVVFVGTMDYYPNVEAVVSFAQKIWPSSQSHIKDARFAIVGANPAAIVRELSRIPGITVTGTVPDVRPYYESAFASVVPLRTGGGTRLKILEAMASGVPVISTPLGAEGLDVSADKNILIAGADDVALWLACVKQLYENRDFAASLSDNARRFVETRYAWSVLGRKLTATYEHWLNRME